MSTFSREKKKSLKKAKVIAIIPRDDRVTCVPEYKSVDVFIVLFQWNVRISVHLYSEVDPSLSKPVALSNCIITYKFTKKKSLEF